jgi:hypothetical protein
MRVPATRLSVAALIACLASCQNPNAPVGVSGNVTLDGQPLPSGVVLFEPTDPARGQSRQAAIENGAFTLPDAEGVLPGTEFRVAIRAFRKNGRKLPYPDMSGSWDETEQYLPTEYNAATTLKVTTSADPASNRFTFELLSRPARK